MVEMLTQRPISVLILGAGWTSTFLIPLLESNGTSYAATSTTGRTGTIKFRFDPENDTDADYEALPSAKCILITFPLRGQGQSSHLLKRYAAAHSGSPQYIQLGSTGIFSISKQPVWIDRQSKYDTSNERAIAEDELRSLGGCVLNLAGLWGGERQPRDWVERVAKTKEQLKEKKSLHLVHGDDVARAIVGLFEHYTPGERWMVTDLFVYDWWALILGWTYGNNERARYLQWIGELMMSEGVKAVPRDPEQLGRCYDSRAFWVHIKAMPTRARV